MINVTAISGSLRQGSYNTALVRAAQELAPSGMSITRMGGQGSSRAKYHLRQIFVFLDGRVMNRPEVFVGAAHTKFDDSGQLIDEGTRDFIASYLEAVGNWMK